MRNKQRLTVVSSFDVAPRLFIVNALKTIDFHSRLTNAPFHMGPTYVHIYIYAQIYTIWNRWFKCQLSHSTCGVVSFCFLPFFFLWSLFELAVSYMYQLYPDQIQQEPGLGNGKLEYETRRNLLVYCMNPESNLYFIHSTHIGPNTAYLYFQIHRIECVKPTRIDELLCAGLVCTAILDYDHSTRSDNCIHFECIIHIEPYIQYTDIIDIN